MSKQTRVEITIGIFVIVAVVSVAGMIIAFGGGSNMLVKTYDVSIQFNHVGDLIEGAPVKLGGVKVGFIRKVSLLENGKVMAVASIIKDDSPNAVKLKKDTTALIQTAGIVGDTFVELVQGESEELLPKDNTAHISQGGGDLMSNIQTISTKAIDTIDKANAAIDNLNKIIGDTEFKDNIHATVANTVKVSEKAADMMTDLKATTEKFQAFVSEDNINKVNETIENIRKSSEDVTKISTDLSSIFSRTDKLFADKEPMLRTSFDNVSDITTDIKEKLAAIDPEKGLMRYLTTDEFNKRFDAIMDQINGITTSLSDMFEGTTKLELLKAYVGGGRMWRREEKELRRMRLKTVTEMENEVWRRDREKAAQRRAIVEAEKN